MMLRAYFSMTDIAARIKEDARDEFSVPTAWQADVEWRIEGDIVKAVVIFASPEHAAKATPE